MKRLFFTAYVLLTFTACEGRVNDIERKVKMLKKNPHKVYCHGAEGIRYVEVTNAEVIDYIRMMSRFPSCQDYLEWRRAEDKLEAAASSANIP